jgi:hypothetical protein
MDMVASRTRTSPMVGLTGRGARFLFSGPSGRGSGDAHRQLAHLHSLHSSLVLLLLALYRTCAQRAITNSGLLVALVWRAATTSYPLPTPCPHVKAWMASAGGGVCNVRRALLWRLQKGSPSAGYSNIGVLGTLVAAQIDGEGRSLMVSIGDVMWESV